MKQINNPNPDYGDLIPIETFYKGCLFRSRLEARTAVFFEEMGWVWIYEHEGFKLASGYYLPDFYLPELNVWVEVKPNFLAVHDLMRCKELSLKMSSNPSGIDVLLLEGELKPKAYRTIMNGQLGVKVLLVAKTEEHYPFYTSDTYNPHRHGFMKETIDAIEEARSSDFYFKWKEG